MWDEFKTRYLSTGGAPTHILKIAEKVGNSFPFIIGQRCVVDSFSRATAERAKAGGDMAPAVGCR
jgi:hypothetical protein